MNIIQAKDSLKVLLRKDENQIITPFLIGFPGIGKTEIIQQIKEEFQFDHLLDIRLSQHDNTDIKGIPDKKENIVKWLQPEFMPLVGSKFEGTSGILFFDEFNRARPDVLQSVFEIVYDRAIGGRKILDTWKIVCAGNFGVDDGCNVYDMDAALRNRFCMLKIDSVSSDCWFDWAEKNNIHRHITGFLKKNVRYLYENNEQEGYIITPRSWAKFSQILLANKDKEKEMTLLLGDGILYVARAAFYEYLEQQRKIEPDEIFNMNARILRELKELDRNDFYELIEKIVYYIKENKEKLSRTQLKNFGKFFMEFLNDDLKIAFFENIKKNNSLVFLKNLIKNVPEIDKLIEQDSDLYNLMKTSM